jgi:4-aminobutyrate---pyruvate transaminase
VLKKYDILFIVDEVICGFGRTGNMFGSQTYKLQPDIMTMAKALSAAYLPISAIMINEKVYKALRDNSGKIGTFGHGYTYSGHPVSAAVALETLKIYEERDIVSQVRRVSPVLLNGLRRFADHPLVGEVRGVGLLAGVELVRNKATKEPFDPTLGVGATAGRIAEQHGMLCRTVGDTFPFCPPLIINEAQIGDMLTRFARVLDDTHSWTKSQGLLAA